MDQISYDSSMEELTPEERLMLVSTKRQEPQGEEHSNVGKVSCHSNAHGNVPEKQKGLDVEFSSSSSSTYSSDGDEDGEDRGLVKEQRSIPSQQLQRKNKKSQHYLPRGQKSMNNMSTDSTNSHSAYNTLIIHQNNSSLLADTWIPASHEFTSYGIGSRGEGGGNSQSSQQHPHSICQEPDEFQSHGRSAQSYSNPYDNIPMTEFNSNNSALTSSELSEIPRDYLDQLTVLKHLAKEVQQDPISGTSGSSLLRSASFSKSQPDLTQSSQYVTSRIPIPTQDNSANYSKSQPQQASRKCKKHNNGNNSGTPKESLKQMQAPPNQQHIQTQQQHHDDVLPSVQILEILMRENASLNAELVNARRKINTIHKLESELNRLQASHEALFASAERRESLERTARAKLNTEVKRLTAVNRELLSSGSLQSLSPLPYSCVLGTSDVEVLKIELAKRDMTIAQLVSQNKEVMATKERQDIELTAQRATLAEQRTHIDILDSALTNAQSSVLRLEEECRKKQEFVDKSAQLQRALSSLQLTNDKREQSEKKVRTQLEGEITDLKLRLASLNVNGNNASLNHQSSHLNQTQFQQQQLGHCGGGSGRTVSNQQNMRSYQSPPYTASKYESNSNAAETQLQLLQEKLKVSEEQIHHLNSQVAKWEHVFTPETLNGSSGLYKGNAGVSSSTPNTPNSWTNSNSRGGTPHFFGGGGTSDKISMEELHHTPHSDLEWKIKDLESRLMEKDAVIRILQTVPSATPSPLYSSNSCIQGLNPGTSLPSYRDSPSYSQASTIQHPISVSMASMMDHHQPTSLMYSKGFLQQQKCDSEPPSYANLPLKLRLGGSGSSLMKNSNESLQLGGGGSSGGNNSPSLSGPGSVSSNSGASGTKSIDDQLKELDSQLLSKDGPGSLKMQSGLCCLPAGFTHSGSAARKGKIPQSLLESLNVGGTSSNSSAPTSQPSFNPQRKLSSSSVLPPKPPSTYMTQGQSGSRTSSGPPFISPLSQSSLNSPLVTTTTALSFSNSVDSILSDPSNTPNGTKSGGGSENCNVFTPAVGMGVPKGLPPRPTGSIDTAAGKSRSLERNKSSNPADSCAGKYTVVMYDGARCRSLDRRELKLSLSDPTSSKLDKSEEKDNKKSNEKETNKKSSVSSKAAFFGQLLTRRSPSPGREKKDKEGSTPKMGRRFPFGGKSQGSSGGESKNESSEEAMLEKQGRQSQRNRISSKWSSCNTLEAVAEQSGSESPWPARKGQKGNESPKMSAKQSKEQQRLREELSDSSGKKWGRIVKTPFGLRYTFGSPRVVAAVDMSSSLKQQEK